MGVVCLDTNVLIWGIKKEASPGREHMIPRAEAFIQHLTNKKTTMVVPSVVLAELLIKVPPEDHTDFIRLITDGFEVPTFDARVAARFAKIWTEKKDHPDLIAAKQAGETTKNIVRADCMVVATALVAGASYVVTNNLRDLRWFADRHIEVLDIPETAAQLALF